MNHYLRNLHFSFFFKVEKAKKWKIAGKGPPPKDIGKDMEKNWIFQGDRRASFEAVSVEASS